jgi:hypothetical protein
VLQQRWREGGLAGQAGRSWRARVAGPAASYTRRREGKREGGRPGQLWLRAKRERREKKKRKSLFNNSGFVNLLKFKPSLDLSHSTLFLHSNKTQCTSMNATKLFLVPYI